MKNINFQMKPIKNKINRSCYLDKNNYSFKITTPEEILKAREQIEGRNYD